MASYLKDKKIEIWRSDCEQRDEDGFPIIAETKIHSGQLWAYYRHVSAKERYTTYDLQEEYEAIFVINHRENLDPRTDYILYKGQKYNIVAIDDFQGYKSDIKITAKLRK